MSKKIIAILFLAFVCFTLLASLSSLITGYSIGTRAQAGVNIACLVMALFSGRSDDRKKP